MWNYLSNQSGGMAGYNVFIGYNPPTSVNPYPMYPRIHSTVYISPFTFIVGDVTIRENVFIAPFVSVRADEGTPFYIGSHTNLQDGVILHGLRDQYVVVNNEKYSVFIGNGVSCAHSSLIHGPCLVQDDVFIGFNSTIFNSIIGKGTFISSGAVVTNGVILKPYSFVPPGASIDTQEKANSLVTVPLDRDVFAREVQRVNIEFPSAYSMFFGSNRCSCGLTC